jgi:TonB-linked SusC/RagA family outer membrane protein
MVRGYKDYSQSVIIAQIELKQKLDFITQGLGVRLMGNTTRDSYFDVNRYYDPFYYKISYYDNETGNYGLYPLNPKTGTEYLKNDAGYKSISTSFYGEAVVDYNKTFAEKHAVSGLLVGMMRESLHALPDANDFQKSLAYRNAGLSGRFTYAYDSRYFTELNFGYNGSERFAKNERFGFFPSIGVGYIVSNEGFWSEKLSKTVNKLKLKATYGLTGNDAIGDANDRFFYLSRVNLNDPWKQNINFGKDFTNRPGGISISRYANDLITWERSRKMNLGLELGILNTIEIEGDYFTEYRTNILMDRGTIPPTMGLQAPLRANVGEASAKGFEVSVSANHYVNKDFSVTGRFNFTFATNKYEVYEELDYPYPWQYNKGLRIGQHRGLIAERLFIDEADIANSPKQTFGDYKPGDIKYMDINGDGVIDSEDFVPIGYADTPEILYGFGMSSTYKRFDLSFFFQGSARSSFFIDPVTTGPFLSLNPNQKTNNAMLKTWADSYWSEENRNIYALWPRLSSEKVENNLQRSTWFLRDGSFLRLKSVEMGYTFPNKLAKKVKVGGARLYVSGLNLLCLSKFKAWDVEMGGNGLGYPIQKVINIGANINF